MDHTVAVAYSLQRSRPAFVASWNADPACARAAVASEPEPGEARYVAELLDAFLVVLGSVSAGISGNALYDLLKERLGRETGKTVVYRTVELPDGTTITEFIESG